MQNGQRGSRPRRQPYGLVAPLPNPLRGLAERVRFELTRACTPAVFKTAAINHSATAPSPRIAREPDPRGDRARTDSGRMPRADAF